MQTHGYAGRSARHYSADELSVLRGRLASDEPKVYPEDRCPECEKEGKLHADEKCFHRHWNKSQRKEAL